MYKVGKPNVHGKGKYTQKSRHVSVRINRGTRNVQKNRANYQFTQFLNSAEKTYERLQSSAVDPDAWIHTEEGRAYVESIPSVKGYSTIVKRRKYPKRFLIWLLLLLQLSGISAEHDQFTKDVIPSSAPMPKSTPSVIPVATYSMPNRYSQYVVPYVPYAVSDVIPKPTPKLPYSSVVPVSTSVSNPTVSQNVQVSRTQVPKPGPLVESSTELVEQQTHVNQMKTIVDFVVNEIKDNPKNVKPFIQALETSADDMYITDMVIVTPHNTVTIESHSFFGIELVSRNQYMDLDKFLGVLDWTDGIGLDIDMAVLSNNKIHTRLTSKHGGKVAIFADKSKADTKKILEKIFKAAEQHPTKLILLRIENNKVSANHILSNLPKGAVDRLYVRDRFRQQTKKEVLDTGKNVMIFLEHDIENESLHIDKTTGNYIEVSMMSQKYHTYRTSWNNLEVLPTPGVVDIMINSDVKLLNGTYPFLIVDAYKSITGTDYSKIKKSVQIIPNLVLKTIPTIRESIKSGVFKINKRGDVVESHFTLGSGAFIMADMVSPSFYMMAKIVNIAIASNDTNSVNALVSEGSTAFAATTLNEIPNITLYPVIVDFFIKVFGEGTVEVREGTMISGMTLLCVILYLYTKNKDIRLMVDTLSPVIKAIIIKDLSDYMMSVGSNLYPIITNTIHRARGGAKKRKTYRKRLLS